MPLALFANPEFVPNCLDYYQDKVAILDDFLQKNNIEINKKIINKYIELLNFFWSYGFHDKTFKLQPNYGVGKDDEIVCVDFGECVFKKEQALQSILSKKWLSRGSYKNWKDEALKKYYTEQMEQAMTQNNLDSTWASSRGNL